LPWLGVAGNDFETGEIVLGETIGLVGNDVLLHESEEGETLLVRAEAPFESSYYRVRTTRDGVLSYSAASLSGFICDAGAEMTALEVVGHSERR
jgi:hypothetical protein